MKISVSLPLSNGTGSAKARPTGASRAGYLNPDEASGQAPRLNII